MATAIINGIYGFNLKSSLIKNFFLAYMGKTAGTRIFSKAVTWLPGAGNVLNAAVAGGTTYALGKYIIDQCETMDRARKRGEKIDNILRGL